MASFSHWVTVDESGARAARFTLFQPVSFSRSLWIIVYEHVQPCGQFYDAEHEWETVFGGFGIPDSGFINECIAQEAEMFAFG